MDETCRDLDTNYGFDLVQFESQVGTAELALGEEDCTEDALRALLDMLDKAGGGTLELPSCEIGLTQPIYVPSRSILQGAGVGQSVLFVQPEWISGGSVVRVYDQSYLLDGWEAAGHDDVVLRDFTVRGLEEVAANNIEVLWSDNVLVERVDSYEAGKSALAFGSSRKLTVRYSTFHHSYLYHGIGSKDCYPDQITLKDDEDGLVSRSDCDGGDPNFWAEDYAIYSNQMYNNQGHGLDSHASFGEVAGNLITSNVHSSKFVEPAHDLWVHDTLFDGGEWWGTKISNQYIDETDETMNLSRHVYYRNQFSSNGTYGVRVGEGVSEIYFIQNSYTDNGEDNELRLTCDAGAVIGCSGDGVTESVVAGSEAKRVMLESDDPRCDLDQVGTLFK